MIILKCDKCGLEEEQSYWNPKLIKNIDDPNDNHMFWYKMVSGINPYISCFPLSNFYINELNANLCIVCLEKWQRFKASQASKIEESYKEFMNTINTEK